MNTTKVGYRSDIDVLRAVAVIAVMLYHFKIGFFFGGFVGVDIFFVISGYLITQILNEQVKCRQPFKLSDFYFRRARRLLPALLVTVAVTYWVGFVMFSPSDFKPLSGSAVYALAGIPNVFFWLESGYFDAAAAIKPLLHTWSLGVEIQFYAVWPVVFLAIMKLTRRVEWVLIALIVGVTVAALYYLKIDASAAFFLTPFRINEFLIGGLIVFLERSSLSRLVSEVVYAVGVLLVAYAIFTFNAERTLFPGFAALVPALGTALMILGGRNSVLARFAASRPVLQVGKVSYSIYLVHWPLFVFVSYTVLGNLTSLHKFFLVLGTFILAFILYYCVESYFRYQRNARLSGAEFSLVAALAAILMMIPAASSWGQNGWSWRVPQEIREIGKIDENESSRYVFEQIKKLNQKHGFDASSAKQKILVIGDSQAGDLVNILNESGYLSKYNVVSRLVDSACATPFLAREERELFFTQINPITMTAPEYIKRCEEGLERADDQKLISEADKIFIAFYWRDFAEPKYLEALRGLASHTKAEIYIFGRKDLSKDSAFIATSLGRTAGLSHYAANYKSQDTETINAPLKTIPNTIYIDMMKATCPAVDECLVVDVDNKPVFFNATHLSREGAIMYGDATKALLERARKDLSL